MNAQRRQKQSTARSWRAKTRQVSSQRCNLSAIEQSLDWKHPSRSQNSSYLLTILSEPQAWFIGGSECRQERKEDAIETEGEEPVSGLLAFLGLFSTFLAAIHQLLRLWEWRSEEKSKDEDKSLAENLELLEARLDAIDEELERLEAEKDCQD